MSKRKVIPTEPEFDEVQMEFEITHLVDEAMDELVEFDMSIREVFESLALSAKAEGFFETKYPNAHAGQVTYCNDGKKVTWSEIEHEAFGDTDEDEITNVMADIEKYSSQSLIDLQLQIALELSDRMA
jgi:hypothetical protein